jgi:hypothetical protein
MFESWTGTIKRNLEQIENYVEHLKKPSLDRIKLDYVLKVIKSIVDYETRHKGRAYKIYFDSVCSQLESLLSDMKYWESDGLFPMYIFRCPECENTALQDIDSGGDEKLLLYGNCPVCNKFYFSQDAGKKWELA